MALTRNTLCPLWVPQLIPHQGSRFICGPNSLKDPQLEWCRGWRTPAGLLYHRIVAY